MIEELFVLGSWFGGARWGACLFLVLFFLIGTVSHRSNAEEDGDGDSNGYEEANMLLAKAVKRFKRILRQKNSSSSSQSLKESNDAQSTSGSKESPESREYEDEVDNSWRSDSDLFEDESIPIGEKVELFRERFNDSDESARLPLVKSLIAASRTVVKRDEAAGFQMLDEAQKLLNESEFPEGEEFEIAQIDVMAHRIFFHIGLFHEPPFELVRELRDRIRRWEGSTDSVESNVCLMRAWFVHAQALLTLGASSSSLTSFENALRIVDEMKEKFGEDVETLPDIPFLMTAYGKACEASGDVKTAIKSYRAAVDIFFSFRTVPSFLAKSSSVNEMLVSLLTSIGSISEARSAAIDYRRKIQKIWRENRLKNLLTFTRALLSETGFYSRTGDFHSAIQSLKKAEKALLQGIQELRKNKNRKRVSRVRKALVDVYSMRASLYFARRDLHSALKDFLDGLRWFNKTLAKNEAVNSEQAFVCFFALAFNMAAKDEKWEMLERYEKHFRTFLSLVASEKLPSIATVVSDTALNLHRINHLRGESSKAERWIDVAVDAMTRIVEKDNENSTRFCFVLVKNLMLRSVFSFAARNDPKSAFADLQRIGELFQNTELSALVGENYETTECYFEFLRRYACMTWRNGDRDKAITLIKKSLYTVGGALKHGNLTVLRELKEIVPIAMRFAAEDDTPSHFFRLFRFWLRYIKSVRAKILRLNPEEEVRRQIERDFIAANIVLFESRIQFLDSLQWNDSCRQFISEEVSSREDAIFDGAYGSISERVEETTQSLGLPSFSEFVTARKTFVFNTLIKRPRDFLLWRDFQMCLRLIDRQTREEGDFSEIKLLGHIACRLSDLYWSYGEARLALTEICYIKDAVDLAAVRKDSSLSTLIRVESVSLAETDESDDFEERPGASSGLQKLFSARIASVLDSVFWNAVFLFWQTFLIAFERFSFGKESSLVSNDPSFASWRDAYGSLIWLKKFSEEEADASDPEEVDKGTDGSSIEVVAPDDYRRADDRQKRFFDRSIDAARILGRKTVLRDFSCFSQYKSLFKLLFVWRDAWGETEELKEEIRGELNAFERESLDNLNLQALTIDFCESLAEFAIDVLRNEEFAIELHERLVDLSTNSFPLAALWMAIRDGFSFCDFFMKLALKANEEGDVAKELSYLFRALDDCAISELAYERHVAFFIRTANVLCELFFKKEYRGLKVARKFILSFEEAFEVVFSKLKERSSLQRPDSLALLQAAWRCFVIAGIYYAKERRCFFLAKSFFDKAWLILETLFLDSDNSSKGVFFSVYLTDSVAFDLENGLIARATKGEKFVSTLCRLFLNSRFAKERVQPDENRQIQNALLRMDMSRLANSIFYASAPINSEALAESIDVVQTRPEFREFMEQKRRNALTSFPFFEKNAGECPRISDEAFQIGGIFFIATELKEFAKVNETGFDRVKRSVKALGAKLRKTCLQQSKYELEFEFNWVRFSCVKQEWSEAYRCARRLRKRFFSPNASIQGGDDQSDFRKIHIELLKIEAFCVLRLDRRRAAVRCQTALVSAFQLFDLLIKERRFEIRTLYAELLTLRAWRQKLLGETSDALRDAERAQKLFERFKKRGFSNWLPVICDAATFLVTTLRQPNDGTSRASSGID